MFEGTTLIFVVFVFLAEFDDLPLTMGKTDMATIVKVMKLPDSGLEIRDRMWLKITIANAVIGKMLLCLSSFNRFVFINYILMMWEIWMSKLLN